MKWTLNATSDKQVVISKHQSHRQNSAFVPTLYEIQGQINTYKYKQEHKTKIFKYYYIGQTGRDLKIRYNERTKTVNRKQTLH